jgi:hypothetical protein
LGLKKGTMVAVASSSCEPKITGSNDGIPTKRARLHTSLAVEFEFEMCRKSSRSKAHPTRGPITTTDKRKASKPDQLWYSVRYVKINAEAKACAPNAKLKTPVAWYVSTKQTATRAYEHP